MSRTPDAGDSIEPEPWKWCGRIVRCPEGVSQGKRVRGRTVAKLRGACYKATEVPVEKIVIDGYNLLYKDGALKNLAERSLESAREELLAAIAAYRTAEMEIWVDMVEKEGRRGALTVVTSDKKDIGLVARSEGVRWISSEAFIRRLHRIRRVRTVPAEKPVSTTPKELEYWLERFGSEGRGKKG